MSCDIRKEIEEYKKLTLKKLHDVKKAVAKDLNSSAENQELEKIKYAEFEKANRGKKFVKLEHIDALGLEYDVLLFISNKNIGKTTNIIYNRFNYYRDRGQKVIFGRVTLDEVKASALSYQESPLCPFKFKSQHGSLNLFCKDTNQHYGRCVSFRNCNSISAGEFQDYGAIIFDEIFTWNPMNLVNTSTLSNFFAFPSSIQRNKKDKIKVYLMGNCTGQNDSLLEGLGINRDEMFRYIVRPNDLNPNVSCKILYINAGNIYRGITDQDGAAQMANQQAKFALNTNTPLERNLNRLRNDLFLKIPFKFCFLINMNVNSTKLNKVDPQGILRFELRGFDSNKLNYAIKVTKFDPVIPCDGPILCDCPALCAKYGEFIQRTASLEVYKDQIYLMMLNNSIDFASNDSYECCYTLFYEIEKNKKYLN